MIDNVQLLILLADELNECIDGIETEFFDHKEGLHIYKESGVAPHVMILSCGVKISKNKIKVLKMRGFKEYPDYPGDSFEICDPKCIDNVITELKNLLSRT